MLIQHWIPESFLTSDGRYSNISLVVSMCKNDSLFPFYILSDICFHIFIQTTEMYSLFNIFGLDRTLFVVLNRILVLWKIAQLLFLYIFSLFILTRHMMTVDTLVLIQTRNDTVNISFCQKRSFVLRYYPQ